MAGVSESVYSNGGSSALDENQYNLICLRQLLLHLRQVTSDCQQIENLFQV